MRERKIREGEITREDEGRKDGGESKTEEVEVVEGKRVVPGSRTALEGGRRGGGRRRLPMEDQVDQKVWFSLTVPSIKRISIFTLIVFSCSRLCKLQTEKFARVPQGGNLSSWNF